MLPPRLTVPMRKKMSLRKISTEMMCKDLLQLQPSDFFCIFQIFFIFIFLIPLFFIIFKKILRKYKKTSRDTTEI